MKIGAASFYPIRPYMLYTLMMVWQNTALEQCNVHGMLECYTHSNVLYVQCTCTHFINKGFMLDEMT